MESWPYCIVANQFYGDGGDNEKENGEKKIKSLKKITLKEINFKFNEIFDIIVILPINRYLSNYTRKSR